MKRGSIEMSVGIFVLVGLVAVGYLAVKLGKMEIMGGDHYTVKARFTSVSGLTTGARVEISGVPVGKVSAIELDPKTMYAVVSMAIRKGVDLTSDAIASVRTAGLIGDKFIKISPGAGDENLKNGDFITETEPAINIEELIGKYVFGSVEGGGKDKDQK